MAASRFDDGTGLRRATGAAWRQSRRILLLGLRTCVEATVFGSIPWISFGLLRLCRRRLADDLSILRPWLNEDFYLNQFANQMRRARAARAPDLHYLIIGSYELKTPSRAFDPVHYRWRNPNAGALPRLFRSALRPGCGDDRIWNNCDEARADLPHDAAVSGVGLLSLTHPRSGGSNHLLSLYERAVIGQGARTWRLRPLHSNARVVVFEETSRPGPTPLDAQVFNLNTDLPILAAHARSVGIGTLLVNHVIDQPVSIFDEVPALARQIGCPYDVFLHDYYSICPRVDLVNGHARFCGGPIEQVCQRCVADFGSQAGDVDPAAWRKQFATLLRGSRRIWCPSDDHARRLQAIVSGVHFDIWQPQEDRGYPPELTPDLDADEIMKIAVVGSLNIPKGLRVVAALGARIQATRSPLSIELIGDSSDNARLVTAGVRVHGRWREEQIGTLLSQAAPHIVLLPAIWPETWSFVLSHALAAGYPTVCFDIGAPADRLRALNRGIVLPYSMAHHPDQLHDALLRIRQRYLANTGHTVGGRGVEFAKTH